MRNKISLDVAVRNVRSKPKPHMKHVSKPEAIAYVESGQPNLKVNRINVEMSDPPTVTIPYAWKQYTDDQVCSLFTNYFATCTILIEMKNDDERKYYVASAAAVSPEHFITAAHSLIPDTGFTLGTIFYTHVTNTSTIADWNDDYCGRLKVVSCPDDIDKKFPGYSMAGEFPWDVCSNDIAVLEIEQSPNIKHSHYYLVPKPCERGLQRAGNVIAICGCAGYVSEEEFNKDYDVDYSLVSKLPYSEVRSAFSNFDQKVVSMGITVAVHFSDNTHKQLATHVASALGGMSGGPLVAIDTVPDFDDERHDLEEEHSRKRKRTGLYKNDIPAIGHFSGLHLGGFSNFGKNVALSVDEKSFVWTYCTYVVLPISRTEWFAQNRSLFYPYLNHHREYIQQELVDFARIVWSGE